ncbi:hypothetical protein KP509_29G053800 [Ceratopteris richardii]|uniref:GDSL esterase/lipase n=1 Tax=Ceratopteris richardii TaxID=49495 RepID=A0A8T2R8S2_CERRI|nr:hypothetical protein KP509_29G053800 [Ceratopteris richardii]
MQTTYVALSGKRMQTTYVALSGLWNSRLIIFLREMDEKALHLVPPASLESPDSPLRFYRVARFSEHPSLSMSNPLFASRLLLCVLFVEAIGNMTLASSASRLLPSSAYPSVYVFGASMVDSGENFVAMPLRQDADFEPYSVDYFEKPTGRWSNGRNLIDFITQGLGIGLLSPYLQSFGSNFTYGVNFASSGSHARNKTASGDNSGGLFCLLVQIDQFREYQESVLSQHRSVLGQQRMRQHFSNSIYFIETAHNDYLSVAFQSEDFDAINLTEIVIAAIKDALQALYDSGARTFLVMNLTPIGCNPSTLTNDYRKENRDSYGCKVDYLELASRHNERLIELLNKFSAKYPAAEWTVFDAYSLMLDAYHNPLNYGVKYPFQACCGYGGGEYNYNADVNCGRPGKLINGTYAVAKKCTDPSLHIIWDSLHPVESFCRYLARGVLDGTHLIPSINITDRFTYISKDGVAEPKLSLW